MTDWNLVNYSTFDEANEAALAALEREQRKLADLTKVINEDTVTVRSKDRSVSMSFDGRGEVTGITFNGAKYRTMAPPELAHVLIETIRAGREQCVRKLAGVMGESLPGIDFAELASGRLDPGEVFEKLVSPFVGEDFGAGVVGRRDDGPQGGK